MERIELPLPCWGRTASPAHGAGPQVALEVQRIAGDAARPTMVFLHEGLGSVSMWSSREGSWPQSVCDAAGAPGIVFSRRGYGRSDAVADVRGAGRLPPDYMHREAFGVLPALLRALGIERPLLVGHSDGGTIALLHASRHPVAGCVVMAPHVIVEDLSIASIGQARVAYESGELRQRLARHHADVDCAFWQWNDVWLSQAFRSFDIRSDCRSIRAPVLAIQGRDDPYGTLRQVQEIAPTQGPLRIEVIDRCGHSPHKDHPQQVRDLVAGFARALN
ncbi:MAG: alpha/beta fold hydrolase [Burkholderiaceae bacterium]|jgi:pimeloyl-ACP methyl ester carboxylesterase